MRKPRDYDAELKALNDKARQLKSRKQSQLGELVMATGADDLTHRGTGRGLSQCRHRRSRNKGGVAQAGRGVFSRGARDRWQSHWRRARRHCEGRGQPATVFRRSRRGMTPATGK